MFQNISREEIINEYDDSRVEGKGDSLREN